MALPSLGFLQYGNAIINGPRVLTKSITQTPRMDAAGRGRSWTEYTLVLRLMLAGQTGNGNVVGTNDANVYSIRQILQQPGLRLIYHDRGYGPLNINVNGLSDCVWGPITKELGWEGLGAGNACYMDWQVKVAIASDTGLSTGTAGGLIELLYSVDFQNDAAGYSTRRISVTARIPGTRFPPNFGGAKELAAVADSYRELLSPPLIPGFRRTYPTWGLDDGKTVLRGEIVDEELGINFLPAGVVLGSASHDVSSGQMGLSSWQATINAEFELEKAAAIDQDDLTAYFTGVLCRDRILACAKAIGTNSNAIVPLSFRMTESEIFGRLKAAFQFSYSFTQPFQKIFGATGLWRPVPGSDWTKWAAATLGGPANPRGYMQLEIQPSDDSIVEGTGGRIPGIFTDSPFIGGVVPVGPNPNVPPVVKPPDVVLRNLPAFPDPQPETSYLMYESWVWLETESGVVPVRPLPLKVPGFVNQVLTGNPFLNAASNAFRGNVFDAVKDVIGGVMPAQVPQPFAAAIPGAGGARIDAQFQPQQRVAPLVYVFLRGHAMRYGFPVPIPALTDYCGVAPVLSCRLDMGEGYGHGIQRAANGKPIFLGRWNIRYLLPGGMQAFFHPPAPPNPILDNS